jgi:mRNA interferase RelE/StbE
MKTIVFTSAAAKQLDALPAQARVALEVALDRYAIEGRGDIKRLQGREGFRMRVGEYRVIFNDSMTTILTIYVGRRQTDTYS